MFSMAYHLAVTITIIPRNITDALENITFLLGCKTLKTTLNGNKFSLCGPWDTVAPDGEFS